MLEVHRQSNQIDEYRRDWTFDYRECIDWGQVIDNQRNLEQLMMSWRLPYVKTINVKNPDLLCTATAEHLPAKHPMNLGKLPN